MKKSGHQRHWLTAGTVLGLAASLFFPGASVSALVSPSTQLAPDTSYWARNIIVAPLGASTRAILDTGGSSEKRSDSPKDFETYYHGLRIDAALGQEFAAHRIVIGPMGARAERIPLDVRRQGNVSIAAITCRIGTEAYQLLFDSAALAWDERDTTHSRPFGTIFLSKSTFERLGITEKSWRRPARVEIMNESGQFVAEPALQAPQIKWGNLITRDALIVERSDSTTYDSLKKRFGVRIDGDASLEAYHGRGILIDFAHNDLRVFR